MGCGSSAAGGSGGKVTPKTTPKTTAKATAKEEKTSSQSTGSETKQSSSKSTEEVAAEVQDLWKRIDAQQEHFDTVVSANARKRDGQSTFPSNHTVRVFVSSTFTDFHSEREVLVKKVFPELREWLEEKYANAKGERLILIECDLRWGVPKESSTEDTIRTCLGELDQCHDETVGRPFFINLLSERYGWVPSEKEVSADLAEQYHWVQGASITTVEILHGAVRYKNPNACFFLRNSSFVKDIPESHLNKFVETEALKNEHLRVQKEQLRARFGDRVVDYECRVKGVDSSTGREKVLLEGLDEFGDAVKNFLMKAIETTYPVEDMGKLPNADEKERLIQKNFLETKAEVTIGREREVEAIFDYIAGKAHEAMKTWTNEDAKAKADGDEEAATPTEPLLLITGLSGTGKTAVISRATTVALEKGMKIFYYFAGCSAKSYTERELLWQLFLFFKNIVPEAVTDEAGKKGEDLNETALSGAVKRAIAASGQKSDSIVIIIDGLEQITEKPTNFALLQETHFPANIRVVCSLSTPSNQLRHQLKKFTLELDVASADPKLREAIVTTSLARYNKRLDSDQLEMLVSHGGAGLPLWLVIVCEELRIFGDFATLTQRIKKFPDLLPDLVWDVLSRLIQEDSTGHLAKILCFIAVSRNVLVEKEIPGILQESKDSEVVPLVVWLEVRRKLKLFLILSQSGSGTLVSFGHNLILGVVKIKLLDNDKHLGYHTHLADFYETRCADKQLIAKELPYHLFECKLNSRLAAFMRSRESQLVVQTVRWNYMKHLSCRKMVAPNAPVAVMCSICAGQMYKFSPLSFRNKELCILCGSFAFENKVQAYPCFSHQKSLPSNMNYCVLCKMMFQSGFGRDAVPVRFCQVCGPFPTIKSCCYLIVD